LDLNYLLSRHQISVMRMHATQCRSARAAHQGLADGYAHRIRALQARSGGQPMLSTSARSNGR
jgi:hypothetical protein